MDRMGTRIGGRTLVGGQALGTILALASVAALVTFVYVLGFAPIDERRSPRAAALSRPPGVISTTQRMRSLLVSGQSEHAVALGSDLVTHHPESAAARLEYAQALEIDGRTDAAREQWERLLALEDDENAERSGRRLTLYQQARARVGIGQPERARPILLDLASSIERSEQGPGGVNAYNLACYLALAGEHQRALEQWETALRGGFAEGSAWWRVDPDLDSIRSGARFWELARAHNASGAPDARGGSGSVGVGDDGAGG